MQKTVQWYPGHMFKAKKELIAQLKNIDVVVEIIDSRVALSSHNEMLDEITKSKTKLLVFSKFDMIEKYDLDKIINKYEKSGYYTICANIKNGNDNLKIINKINLIAKPLIDKYAAKGIVKKLRVAVVGMPNVGKSSFINFLVGKKKVVVGNKPGVTKQQQWINVNENLEILDTPGILVPKIEDINAGYRLVCCQLVKDEVVHLDDVCVYLLNYLFENHLKNLELRYNSKFESFDVEDIYEKIGRSIGALISGGEIDYERVTKVVINDYRNLKFGKITLER